MTPAFISMHEWENKHPKPGCPLKGLSLSEHPSAQQLAKELTANGQLEILELPEGISIRTSSYVGRIELGDLTIAVQPKITGMPLLNLLRYAYGLRDLNIYRDVAYAVTKVDFHDLLIHQFVAETANLFARGLHRDYIKIDGMLSIPRGRIDFTQYTKLFANRSTVLPCIYHERSMNNPLNQALLYGLDLGSRLATDIELRTLIRRMTKIFSQEIPRARLNRSCMDIAWRSLDRRTTAYEPALKIIELMIESQGISLEESLGHHRFSGFLFDMNRFFQALLSRFLQENLNDLIVRDECRLTGMFAYDPEYNPFHRTNPVLRPDFVVLKDNNVMAVLDAKYRDLSLKDNGLPREMLYQLSLYALSQPKGKRCAVILYPTMQPNIKDQVILIQEPLRRETKGKVILRPVCLPELEELLRKPSNSTQTRKKEALALNYAFGT